MYIKWELHPIKFVFFSIACFLMICLSKYLTNEFIVAKIPTDIYKSPNLTLAYLSGEKNNLFIFSLVLILTFISYYFNRDTKISQTERAVLYSCLGIIWFSSVCIPPNWYYNQIYLFDRFLLSILFIFALFRPYLTLLFWFVALLFIKQMQSDFFYFSFSDKKIIYELILFSFLFLTTKRFLQIPIHFFFVSVWSIFSLWYFLAGYGKIELGFWHTKLVNYFLASLAYGWLQEMPRMKEFLLYFFDKFNLILIALTLIAELGVVLFFTNKKYAVLLSVLLWGMHFGILIASGLFFWKWMVLNITTIFVVLFIKEIRPAFSVSYVFVNTIFILSLSYFFKDTKLSWLDTGVVNYHRFSVISDQKKIPLDASFFSPYDFVFAQNRFFFLEDKPVLMGSYGNIKTNLDVYFEILNNKGDKLNQIISRNGKNNFDPFARDRFMEFVSTFIKNKSFGKYAHLPFYAPNHEYQGKNQKRFSFKNSAVSDIVVDYYEIDMRDMYRPDTLTHRTFTINLEK